MKAPHLGFFLPRKICSLLAPRWAGFFTVFCCLVFFSATTATAQRDRWVPLQAQVNQLYEQGKYAEALPMARESVRVAEATYGPEHPRVALALNLLALLLTHQEKFAEAEPLYRRAVSINEKALGPDNPEVGAVLNNLAELYRKTGHYADAEKLYQRVLSIQEKALGPNDPKVATDLNNLAVLYEQQGRYTEAEPLYRRAIAIDQKALGPEDSGLALDFNNLAALYYKQGKYADAEPLYAKALAIHLKKLGKDSPTVATDLNNLGALYTEEGKYPTAEATYQRALAIDEKALGPQHSSVAMDLNNLAALYEQQARYAEAEPLYRRALAIREKVLGPDHPEVASSLNALAALYLAQGKYAEAEPLYRHALAIGEKSLGPNHPFVALTLSNLAQLSKAQGKFVEAEPLYRRAISIDLKTLGQEHPRVATGLNNLATLYIEEGRFADAEKLLRGALAINENALGQSHPTVAKNLNNLAECYINEGKSAEAKPLLERALAIAEKIYGPNHPDVATDLINLAGVYEDEGKYAEADPLFRRALSILENSVGPDHPKTGEALMNLAVNCYGWDKPEAAEPYFDRRLGNLAKQFESNFTYMSERERLGFLRTVAGAFPLFFSFSLKYHERDPALAGKMYDVLLWEKGFIAASAAALRAKILASGDKEAMTLLDKLTAKKTQLAGLISAPQGDPAQWRKAIGQLAQEANDLEKELVKRSAALSAEKTLAHVTWRDVQKTLKPGEAAVEFVRFQFHNGKSWTGTFYYAALVVTPQSTVPSFIVLGEAQKLESDPMAGYRASVGRTRGFAVQETPAAAGGASSSAAYDAFWKPIEPALAATKVVYVSADGVLNQIPLGLLEDGTGKLLLEKYDLRPVNRTKDLLRPQHAAASKTAVLFGNPKFNLTEPEQRAALERLNRGNQQRSLVAAAAVGTGPQSREAHGGPLPPLPGTQIEVDAVGKLLKQAQWQVDPYTGDRALEEVFDRLRSPRLVHVATHGFFLSDQEIAQEKKNTGKPSPRIVDPMLRSGLYFAGADRAGSGAPPAAGLEDGVLTAYEATQLDLQGTELVVLSACETGLGEQQNGEGVFGLRRGLQEAGAEAVLMSMWSVPDQETQELMTLFYQGWLGGLDKHAALRQAQMKERETVRQRYGKDLPYYWGAFVLVGR